MGHRGIFELLYRLLPFAGWKSRLAGHMESCPSCSARLAGKEEVRRVLVQADDLRGLHNIWPAVRRAMGPGGSADRETELDRPSLLLRWAAAASGLALAAVLVVGTVRYLGNPGPGASGSLAETNGFILHSVRIENEPAKTYIIHPKDNGMVVVWVEKSL